MSTLIAFSLQRGLSLWIILEVNFLSFIGLLSMSPLSGANRSLNYFLVQALGRRIMLIRLILLLARSSFLYTTLFFYALVMKLGGAPFHNWYLMLVQKLSWRFIWVLACWQKIIPLLIISLNIYSHISLVIWATILVGSFGTVKQSSVKKIFAFSSIFTLGWILAAILIRKLNWLSFFSGYAIRLGGFVLCVSAAWPMSTKRHESYCRLSFIIFLFTMLLAMRGIPPFLGFFLKLLVLNQVLTLSTTLAMALVSLRLLIIAAYLRVIFNLLTLINSSTLNLVFSFEEKSVAFEFIVLNRALSILFLNFRICNLLHK